MCRAMRHVLILIALVLAPAASADPFAPLRQPGAIALMRHALAPGTADPANFDVTDCATQRNLDALGRAQARAIGGALRAAGIAFDAVLSSQWCRCRETAELMGLGPVTPAATFNSFFETRHQREALTAGALEMLSETPGRLLVVTHQVNITALTGRPTRSGEIVIVELVDGQVKVRGSIAIAP